MNMCYIIMIYVHYVKPYICIYIVHIFMEIYPNASKQDIKAVEKILSNQQVLETRNENVH